MKTQLQSSLSRHVILRRALPRAAAWVAGLSVAALILLAYRGGAAGGLTGLAAWGAAAILAAASMAWVLLRWQRETRRAERATKELYSAREGFQWFLDSLSEYALFLLDTQGRVETWSRSAERICGFKFDDVRGQPLAFFIVDPEATGRARVALDTAQKRGRFERGLRWQRAGAAEFWAQLLVAAIRDERGTLTGYTVLLRDTTQERRDQLALQRETKLREAVLDTLPGIFYMFDRNRQLVRWNRNLARVSGYAESELAGRRLEDFLDPARSHRIDSALATVLQEGATAIEGDLITKDGRRIRHLFTVHRMHSLGASFLIGVGIDISERERERAARERLAAILEATPDFVAITDPKGRMIYLNKAGRDLSRLSPDVRAEKLRLSQFMPAWALDRLYSESLPSAKNRSSWSGELALRGPDGEIPVSLVVLAHRDPEGHVEHFSTIARDISARRHAESALAASEARYRALYHDNPAMFFTVDEDGVLLSVNRFGAERLGYAPEDLHGRPLQQLLLPPDELADQLKMAASNGNAVHRWDMSLRRADREVLWVRASARAVERDGSRQFLLVCEDITQARQLTRELAYQATHDALTGLYNRREFERRLEDLFKDARRTGTRHALCYLDLDQFKVINDTSGHIAGDELLRKLSVLLAQEVGPEDTLARVGGDEFGLLLEHRGLDDALALVGRLRDVVEAFEFSWGERRFRLAVSIGVVPISPTSRDTSDLLRQADLACYAAKDEGRNRIHVYHPDDRVLVRRHGEMEWVAQIPRALEEGRFRLYAQRIAPLHDNDDQGHFEFLLRMVDRDGQIVSPGSFLPAAERYGLTTTLDRWVVGRALDWLQKGSAVDRTRLDFCSINLSGHSLGDADFRRFLLDSLDRSGIVPRQVCFEITETAAISDFPTALEFIEDLKAEGCRFALDDFGTGLSSYAYLKHLPVDYLKIDGAFVRDIASDPIDRAFVRSIHEVGHAMGMQTIAEFAENSEILGLLREIGVDYAQGHGVGRPEPLELQQRM